MSLPPDGSLFGLPLSNQMIVTDPVSGPTRFSNVASVIPVN